MDVRVIGAGLAGAEAVLQLAEEGISVELHEMRPAKKTGSHKTAGFAELVCSNEFYPGRLRDEAEALGSFLLKIANSCGTVKNKILTIDKESFQSNITKQILSHPRIKVINEEAVRIDSAVPAIIASGPLTSPCLAESITQLFGKENISFFTAAEPVIDADTIDLKNVSGSASDTDIYLPMTKSQFGSFYNLIISSPKMKGRLFPETLRFLEQHPPIEDIAAMGADALLEFLHSISSASNAHAEIKLKRDKLKPRMLRLFGFKSNLRLNAQQAIIRSIPGLEKADILRYAHIHKNTFINSPKILNEKLQARLYENLFFAGQITGTDGYIEAIASGLLAGKNMACFLKKQNAVDLGKESMLGALTAYISFEGHNLFQPAAAHKGMLFRSA